MSDQPNIQLNLDTLEREESYEPFVFILAKRAIRMTDPAEMDWQFLVKLQTEEELITEAMSKGDAEFFLAQKLPAWKMRKVSKDYQDHFGIEDPKG